MDEKDIIEFPRWVVPHDSHITTDSRGHQIPQGFADFHWDRVGRQFSVLVANAEEEARALKSTIVEPEAPEHLEPTDIRPEFNVSNAPLTPYGQSQRAGELPAESVPTGLVSADVRGPVDPVAIDPNKPEDQPKWDY